MIQRRVLVGLVGPELTSGMSRWCQDLGADFGLDHSDRYRIELCVEELAANLVDHGGPACLGESVELSAEVDERQLTLLLVDRCTPFDPLAFEPAPIPGSLAELKVGGRGVQLLLEFSDTSQYEYRDGRNRLTLTFHLVEPARVPPRIDGLDRVAIFRGVPEEVVDEALGVLTVLDIAEDLPLLERGEQNRSVLLLLGGALRVYLDRPEGDDFAEVGVGEVIGEMSVIDNRPVSAHVRAVAGARLLTIDADTFLGRLLAIPAVARNLLSAQADRTRRNDKRTIERMRQLMLAEQARREMEFARDIQASLLPAEPLFAEDGRVDCVGRMRPAREVGGDFYDVFFLDPGHLLFVIADVCGKGLPAALFMVRAIAALRAQPRQQTPSENHVAELFASLNEQLCEHNPARQYMTAFCGLLDLQTHRLRYVNAGHNPPLLAAADGPFEFLRDPVNPPVGMVPGLSYRSGEVQIQPGGRLLLYTDGVTEAENSVSDMLGEERLLDLLRALPEAASANLVDAVFRDVETFASGAAQSDDITVLAIGARAVPDSPALSRLERP